MPGYISEFYYGGANSADWIEIAVPAGTDVSSYSIYLYEPEGTIGSGPLSLGTAQVTVGGLDVYVVDASTAGFGGFDVDEGVALVDDTGTVLQFLSVSGETITASQGPANGLTSTSVGTASGSNTLQSDDGGASYYTQTSANKGTVPCYAPGTLIDTTDGPRAVEALAVGDLVETLDHGPMPIRWVRQGDQPLDGTARDKRPILIREGAFGAGCPARDLVVSPQHRILVGGAGQLDGRFDGQCFAPAKALTCLPGIRVMMGKRRITWIHFALQTHEVVHAEGCMSESLLLGPMVLNGLTGMQRRALTEIFGPARDGQPLNGPAARDCLRVGQVRRLLAGTRPDAIAA